MANPNLERWSLNGLVLALLICIAVLPANAQNRSFRYGKYIYKVTVHLKAGTSLTLPTEAYVESVHISAPELPQEKKMNTIDLYGWDDIISSIVMSEHKYFIDNSLSASDEKDPKEEPIVYGTKTWSHKPTKKIVTRNTAVNVVYFTLTPPIQEKAIKSKRRKKRS